MKRDILLIVFASLILHLAGTWSVPLIDRDEPRFAEATREMLQRGDYVIPWFNNKARYDKPPLIYWLQMPCYKLFGENEFAARLPSVLSAVLTSILLYFFGRRMGGRKLGFWAAVVFATSLQTILHAKGAVADMLMVFLFTAAAWCAWELARSDEQKGKFRWWWAFVVSLALAFLAKGPIGLLPILFPFVASALTRQHKPLAMIRPFWAALLVLGLVSLWGVPALEQTDGKYWEEGIGKHVVQRSVNAMEGHGAKSWLGYVATLPLYFVTVFLSFFPWSIWLVWLGWRLWKRRREWNWDEVFLLSGVLLVFVIFSLIRTKLPHYTLPAFPLMALLLVREWQRQGTSMRWPSRLAAGMAIAATLGALILPHFLAPMFPAKELAKRCAPFMDRKSSLASTEYEEPTLVWYFREHIDGFHKPQRAAQLPGFMAGPGPKVCVLPTDQVAATFPNPPSDWHRVDVEGFNAGKGQWMKLTAFVKSTRTRTGL